MAIVRRKHSRWYHVTYPHWVSADKRATLNFDGRNPTFSPPVDNFANDTPTPSVSHCAPIPVALLLTSGSEMSDVKTGKKTRSAIADVVSREYTINLHKRVR